MRIIHYSNLNGDREGVYFTEDLELDAEEVLPPNCTVDNDFVIDEDFPSTFITEQNLEK